MLAKRSFGRTICMIGLLQQISQAYAADITLQLSGQEGETASVFLEDRAKKWAATNGSKGNLFRSRSGKFKSGTNVVPGFSVKGTGLLVGDSDSDVEAFFYNLMPSQASPGDGGEAHFLGTGKVGRWTVR